MSEWGGGGGGGGWGGRGRGRGRGRAEVREGGGLERNKAGKARRVRSSIFAQRCYLPQKLDLVNWDQPHSPTGQLLMIFCRGNTQAVCMIVCVHIHFVVQVSSQNNFAYITVDGCPARSNATCLQQYALSVVQRGSSLITHCTAGRPALMALNKKRLETCRIKTNNHTCTSSQLREIKDQYRIQLIMNEGQLLFFVVQWKE